MKRALTLLSLILTAACASNDGFVENVNQQCGPGSEIGLEAGWDMQASAMEMGSNRLTMLVRVSNNSHHEITVKRVYVDPMSMDDDSPYQLVRGAAEPNQVIAEGDASTFEIQMIANRRAGVSRSRASSAAEVSVTVLLEPEQTYRCRFQVPMGF